MAQGFDATKPAFQDPLLSDPMRVNLNALSSTNSGPTAPSNPKEGMLWMDTTNPSNIKLNAFITSAWRTILQNIQAGPPTQTSVGKFVFSQSPASATWNVLHNLATIDLSVSVIDSSASPEEIMIPNTIQIIDENNLTITFTSPQEGRATLQG